jgi:hypothetical protein
MYAKIKNGQIKQYPYTNADIRKDNPRTSFCFPLDEETMNVFNIVSVSSIEPPSITYREYLSESAPEKQDGVWRQVWVINTFPTKEITAKAKELRASAYREEADPLFFKSQRGEATHQEWLDKVNEIKRRYPEGL